MNFSNPSVKVPFCVNIRHIFCGLKAPYSKGPRHIPWVPFSWLRKTHHVGVRLSNIVIFDILLQQFVHISAVGSDLPYLPFNSCAILIVVWCKRLTCRRSGASRRTVTNIRDAFMYTIRFTRKFQGYKKTNDWNRFKQIEYQRPHLDLDLWMFDWLSNASGDFIIVMRRLIGEIVRPIIQCFSELINHREDNRKFLFLASPAFFIAINRRPAASSWVSYFMMAVCRFCIKRFSSPCDSDSALHSYLSVDNFDKPTCLFASFPSLLLWRRFEQHLDNFVRDASSLPESKNLRGELSPSLFVSTVSIISFVANSVLHFLHGWYRFGVSRISQ